MQALRLQIKELHTKEGGKVICSSSEPRREHGFEPPSSNSHYKAHSTLLTYPITVQVL